MNGPEDARDQLLIRRVLFQFHNLLVECCQVLIALDQKIADLFGKVHRCPSLIAVCVSA